MALGQRLLMKVGETETTDGLQGDSFLQPHPIFFHFSKAFWSCNFTKSV